MALRDRDPFVTVPTNESREQSTHGWYRLRIARPNEERNVATYMQVWPELCRNVQRGQGNQLVSPNQEAIIVLPRCLSCGIKLPMTYLELQRM